MSNKINKIMVLKQGQKSDIFRKLNTIKALIPKITNYKKRSVKQKKGVKILKCKIEDKLKKSEYANKYYS